MYLAVQDLINLSRLFETHGLNVQSIFLVLLQKPHDLQALC